MKGEAEALMKEGFDMKEDVQSGSAESRAKLKAAGERTQLAVELRAKEEKLALEFAKFKDDITLRQKEAAKELAKMRGVAMEYAK